MLWPEMFPLVPWWGLVRLPISGVESAQGPEMNTSSVSAHFASPPEQPKRRLLIQMGFWGLVLLAAGLVVLVSWYRHRQVTVSPQTTYATQPLTPQGLPDYAAWYRQQHESPASPEENALVLLLRAHGRKGFSLSMLQELCDRLGIEVPPESSAGFVPLPEELHRRIGHEEPRWGERIFQLQETELARLAQWLEQNRQALALAVQASRKRRLWLPLYPQLPPRPPLAATDAAYIFAKEWTSPSWNTWIVSALIDNPFRALRLRALVHMRRGRLQQAWQDLLAAWRLAQLQAQGLTLEDSAESVQKQELLHPLALMCLRQGPPDAELALSILKQLKPSLAAFLPRQLVLLRLSTLHWVLQAHQEQALCRELAVMTSVDSWLYLEPASSPPSANRSPLVFPELSLRLSPHLSRSGSPSRLWTGTGTPCCEGSIRPSTRWSRWWSTPRLSCWKCYPRWRSTCSPDTWVGGTGFWDG